MKITHIFATLAAMAALTACSDNGKQKAELLLGEAQSAYEQGDYNRAKTLIDSIETAYPKCFEARKAGNLLKYRLTLAEEELTLEETSKLIEEYAEKINETTQNLFVYEKSEYDELGRYIFKGSEVEKNVQRSYVHAAVDEYGVTQLISTYAGGKEIGHTALRIVASEGESVQTEAIAYNDGSNYHYSIDGTHYESVTYVGGKDNGALGFIAMHADDKKLKAYFVCRDAKSGEKKEVEVAISAKEREALAASYELGVGLSNLLRFTQQNKVAKEKIVYLQGKISEKSKSN